MWPQQLNITRTARGGGRCSSLVLPRVCMGEEKRRDKKNEEKRRAEREREQYKMVREGGGGYFLIFTLSLAPTPLATITSE